MNTPAAKRRRVDAANATFRKPFHSPLLKRQPGAGDNGTPGPSTTPETNSNKRSFDEVYSPSSPSVARQQPQAASPLNRPGHGRPTESSPKPSSPLVARKEKRVKERRAAGPGDEDDDKDDNPFLALARAHRTRKAAAERDAIVKDLDRRLDLVRQAREIEAASERRRPGEPVDQELRDLVARWRAAGRAAAEELFETVKERVDNAGGPKAWREMQQRQMEFYRGFDQDPPAKSRDSDEDSDREFSQDVQAHLEGVGEEEEEDETDFNMGHMLQSLNIDFSLLGYDEKEDKWIN
ncbi:hypothetical protein KVR01_010452 [Diaporthe batatas]|uniref:uncharacterized protein n=1 Tax=Diaporthe batatas TaxID=748121 RepID=UPI001D045F77|nr:uncharacterized protein KVR01_010452 [Diaporthe batatas]KAG8159815.1 hypothetical protein KVR01_010452 [Diaporthe batatas]